MKLKFYALVISTLFLGACSNDDDSQTGNNTVTVTDVYVAGVVDGKATYYKNNQKVELIDGVDIRDIKVSKTGDVYAVGVDTDGAAYWKNGIKTDLGIGAAIDVEFANNEDVYILKNDGTYYLNGTAIELEPGISKFTTDLSIDADNNVYISGKRINNAGYWVNGSFEELLSTPTGTSYANGIVFLNGNIHVIGNMREPNQTVNFKSIYWLNGTSTDLSNFSDDSYVEGIKVTNNSTYLVGYQNDGAFYWKNGTKQNIGTTLAQNAEFYDVDVVGNDVYIVGDNYQDEVGYWLNLNYVLLDNTPTSAYMNSVFVNQYNQ